jgi:hypothetical protein
LYACTQIHAEKEEETMSPEIAAVLILFVVRVAVPVSLLFALGARFAGRSAALSGQN